MSSTSRRRWVIGLTAAAATITVAGVVGIVGVGTLGRTTSTPPPSVTPSPSPSPPTGSVLPLKARYQKNPYYAAPAAAVLSLSSFGIEVSQSTMAAKMKMTSDGEYSGEAFYKAVNGYLHDTPYLVNNVGGPDSEPDFVMREVAYDVGVLRRAPMLAVWAERLPWHQDIPSGQRVDHMVVAVGYDRARGTVTVFDPWPGSGGVRTLRVGLLARALRLSGLYFIYQRSWSWDTPTPTASRRPSADGTPI
ncbi:hypothetical protein GCM10023195_84120 [Actinoallomurus liliacearum]|uniref:Peptidase C39-like domain-containing protein n=1 Tax=Actinoallomurus liliacearum TaxID=1080073 RepID=A0ABP8U273_9ACTN